MEERIFGRADLVVCYDVAVVFVTLRLLTARIVMTSHNVVHGVCVFKTVDVERLAEILTSSFCLVVILGTILDVGLVDFIYGSLIRVLVSVLSLIRELTVIVHY